MELREREASDTSPGNLRKSDLSKGNIEIKRVIDLKEQVMWVRRYESGCQVVVVRGVMISTDKMGGWRTGHLYVVECKRSRVKVTYIAKSLRFREFKYRAMSLPRIAHVSE